ncbi:MAG: hypothetical protein ACLR76_04230 [Alistipes sp.]
MIPREKLLETLRRYWGYERFRPLQLETIEDVCAGRDTLVLMPTEAASRSSIRCPP